jgi:uncharacterized membrane protein
VRPGLPEKGGLRIKGLRYYSYALYGAILLAFAVAEGVLMQGLWRPFDIATYYGLASSAVSSIEAAMGAPALPPLLLFDMGPLSAYRIYVVCVFLFACAVLVLEVGRKRYGDAAGALAGLLFTLNVAWAQGHITIGDSLCLTALMLSAYALLDDRYALAGLFAGTAACFKPLAIFMLPASLVFVYRNMQMKRAPALFGAALAPLILISMMAFSVYWGDTMTMAADSGLEAVGFLTYEAADPLMAVASLAIAACMLASLLPLALLGLARHPGPAEAYFITAGACFIATLALRQYFEYWLLGLPFLALLCVSAFRRPSVE